MVFFLPAQVVMRLNDETPEHFASRFKPYNSVITYRVIPATWNNKSVIFAFYDQEFQLPKQKDSLQQGDHRIIAIMFAEGEKNHFTKVLVDLIGSEGGSPVIDTLFFLNADSDTLKELALVVSWEQKHYDVNGTLYGTLVFDNMQAKEQEKLTILKEISEKLDGGCECTWKDGTRKKAKFKTAAEITKELERLGYKQ